MNAPYYGTYAKDTFAIRTTTHEICFVINDRPTYVRICDPDNNLSDRQLKSIAWKHLKKSARVEIRRNI